MIYEGDCMLFMLEMPDKAFELAIVDPPYGQGTCQEYGNTRGKPKQYPKKSWDEEIPGAEYWKELFRVSANQIVWGGNYFSEYLPPSRGWIYWQKLMGGNYADGELAWTSFDCVLREFTQRTDLGGRTHPTQKPISLYRWLLQNYANPGDKILDTHLGSGTNAIAAYDMGFDFTGYEADPSYFRAAKERIEKYMEQNLFVPIAAKEKSLDLTFVETK